MKLHSIAGVGLMAIGLGAGPTSAYTLVPANTSFTAFGEMSVNAPGLAVGCGFKLRGKVDSVGVGKIEGANFETGGNCPKPIKAAGLPWKLRATGSGRGKIIGMAIIGDPGFCGPGDLRVLISAGGIISIESGGASLGDCTLYTNPPPIQTTPAITTAP